MTQAVQQDAKVRMIKSIEALTTAFAKIRTGRAHPSLLDTIRVPYYGADAPLSQVANITVEDARTLLVRAWEKALVPVIEKAILKSDLGLNPATAGEVIRIPLPPLTEETRKGFIRQARQEAEQARVAIRNIRRDALANVKTLARDKVISEDDERRAQDDMQKLTDQHITEVDKVLAAKEQELMVI